MRPLRVAWAKFQLEVPAELLWLLVLKLCLLLHLIV